ncbi:hypothetical protein CEE37_04290 [candidate division LCP-89 bacterium B3_LCP]|uniref:HEPN AbiU2-like domain-containing protein n=1 Tax=candidate division LCP-89 bacterium B3_LCP TaxID=2012998 RepID=A0A532V3M6_UNCL8|nr:MAG: hypothetical protein CEE37_04290 [candidate division LCP-89 bacterium B3_LCP]
MTKQKKIKVQDLSLDEVTNSIDYLEKAYYFIQQTEKEKNAWKWVMLSLHGALYGFAICACRGSSNRLVTKKDSEDLISIRKALEYCRDKDIMGRFVHSKPLILTEQQEESIERLIDEFRNRFIHFMPTLRSIELHDLPKVSLDILDAIRFLALETGNILCQRKNKTRRIKSLIFQSRKILKKMSLYTESLN